MPGTGGTRRVAVEKNRSRSFGYDGKRFARDDTANILIALSHPRRKNWGAPRMGQPLFVGWGGVFLLSSSQRRRLAGPYFIFGIFVAFAAVGDESPTYQSSPDTRLVSFCSCCPPVPECQGPGAPGVLRSRRTEAGPS